MALMRDGVWSIVNGSEESPDSGDRNQYSKFVSRRDKALATIVLSVDPSLLYLIGDPEDPVAVWKKLSDQFQKKLVLRRRLHSLRLKEGDLVQEHVKAMTEIFNELAVIGEEITEEDRVVYLLASLPKSFNALVTALEANAEVPRMEIVTERLLNEERKQRDHETSVSSEGALAAKRHMKWRSSIKCYRCHKTGHIQRNCPERVDHSSDRTRQSSVDTVKTKDKQREKKHVINKVEVTESDSESDIGLVTTSQVLAAKHTLKPNHWIIDSGATCHICNDEQMFTELKSFKKTQSVILGDGHCLEATARGVVKLRLVLPDGVTKGCQLHDVLYVPDLSYNLVSVSKMAEAGKRVNFYNTRCLVTDQNERVIAIASKKGNLYYLNCVNVHHPPCVYVAENESVWHRRYGHLGEKYLQQLEKDKLVKGFNYDVTKSTELCEPCVQGKLCKSKFPSTGRKRAVRPLELVHSDVCGKLKNKSLSGAEYFLSFIDDKTHFTWVYMLKKKDEVFQKFREWKAMVERESGHRLKTLRTDNGGEYTSTEFKEYLETEGVRHELTIPKTPEQNGVAERMNRTLVEAVRSMLIGAKLPKKFWAECLSTAVYLRNRSPSKTVVGMTPFEAWNDYKPDVSHLRVFGCTVYAHIEKDERSKLDSKARKCILLGYGAETKGYRLYDVEKERVIHSRNVVFEESKYGIGEMEQKEPEKRLVELEKPDPEEDDGDKVEESELNSEKDNDAEKEPIVRRSQRESRRPDYYGDWINSVEMIDKDPNTVSDALSSPEKQEWKTAMDKEMQSIYENDVWDLVELPKQRKAIGCKWVFKRKVGADGSVERYKARLVAQGFSQQYGLDYDETFCPVVRFESLRTVIAFAVQNNLYLHQMDFTSAFLNGSLKEEVYMKQPEGFVEKQKEHLVCKLKHSLYGLKQSPRCWNSVLDVQLKRMGFEQSSSDPCIYTLSGGATFIIGVYVDDIILAGKDRQQMEEIKGMLAKTFDIKDLGELKYFLGVKIRVNHKIGTVWIGQPMYIENVLKKYGMENAKAISTPVDVGTKLVKAATDSEFIDPVLYQSAVGSLLYLSTKTRPDIAYAVNSVARFSSNPTKQHWMAVKRIFRYLRGTTNLGLLYKKSSSNELIGFSDADWGGDVKDFRSTSGYCFEIGGTIVSWRSKKQSCVALSTAEAEYMALSSAAQEAVWLRELCKDLNSELSNPTVIFEDNQAAIKMAKNPQYHGRSKHISIKYHFIREQVSSNLIELRYCRTDDMIADIFTKGLSTTKFIKLRDMAGIKDLSVCE